MTSKWNMFERYASQNPSEFPRSQTKRAQVYKRLLKDCEDGVPHPLCTLLAVARKQQYAADRDNAMLQAKIRALEEIMHQQDEDVRALHAELEDHRKYIATLEQRLVRCVNNRPLKSGVRSKKHLTT